jgi:hypothetical protein
MTITRSMSSPTVLTTVAKNHKDVNPVRSRLLNRIGFYEQRLHPQDAVSHWPRGRRVKVSLLGAFHDRYFGRLKSTLKRSVLLKNAKHSQVPFKYDFPDSPSPANKVQFADRVSVVEIPNRFMYDNKEELWGSRAELKTNAKRNKWEYHYEYRNLTRVVEDEDFCIVDGEWVHPAHCPWKDARVAAMFVKFGKTSKMGAGSPAIVPQRAREPSSMQPTQFVVKHAFQGDVSQSQLSLHCRPGATIMARPGQEGDWWWGFSNGQEGWFPSLYVSAAPQQQIVGLPQGGVPMARPLQQLTCADPFAGLQGINASSRLHRSETGSVPPPLH